MSSIMDYNGGAVVAMAGNGCVAIATDRRLGINAQTVSHDFPKAFQIQENIYLGLSGLATDIQTLSSTLNYKAQIYSLEEPKRLEPKVFAKMLSHMLYQKRFAPYFCESIVAGLDKCGTPILYSTDTIGCLSTSDDFAVIGNPTEGLYGMCEALFEPKMDQDSLFESISQALLSSIDRCAIAGWGATVYLITLENIITRELKARMD